MASKRSHCSSPDNYNNLLKKTKTEKPVFEESEDDSLEIGEEEYPIKCVIDESRTKYLIDWEGPFSPTWEPKACASESAVEAWLKKLRRSANEEQDAEGELSNHRQERQAKLRILRLSSSSETNSNPSLSPPPGPRDIEPYSSPLFVPCSLPENSHRTGQRDDPSTPFPDTGAEDVFHTSPLSLSSTYITDSLSPYLRPVYRVANCDTIPESVLPPYDTRALNPQTFRASDHSITDSSIDTPPYQNFVESPHRETETSGANISSTVVSHISCSLNSVLAGSSQLKCSQSTRESQSSANNTVNPAIAEFSEFGDQSGPNRLQEAAGNSFIESLDTQLPYGQLPSRLVHSTETEPGNVSLNRTEIEASPVPSYLIQPSPSPQQHSLLRVRTLSFSKSFQEHISNTMDSSSQERRLTYEEALAKWKHVPGETGREKLRNAMAGMRARHPTTFGEVPPSESVTPSSAGDIDPMSTAPAMETAAPLSVRVDKEITSKPIHHEMDPPTLPEVEQPSIGNFTEAPVLSTEPPTLETIQPSALTVSEDEVSSPGSVLLGPSEFAIPVPMDSRIKDDYEKVLFEHASAIRNILHSSADENNDSINAVRRAVQKLDNITFHPDLNIAEHLQSSQPLLEQEASWAEYSSSKFQFLGHFLEIAADRELHIIVMVKKVDLVERYFLGKGLMHTRPRNEPGSNVEIALTNGALSFGIQTTNPEGPVEAYKRPTAIIALDSSFNIHHPSVELLRTTYASHGNLLPVVLLLVANTSEHIQRCLTEKSEYERLRQLLHNILRFRDVVGDLQDDALGVTEDAEELLSYLLSDNFNSSWNLPTIEPLKFATDESDSTVEPGSQVMPPPPLDFQNTGMLPGPKRTIDEFESDGPSIKRQRVTETQETATQTSQLNNGAASKLDTDTKILGNNLAQIKSAHAEEIRKLQSALSELQTRFRENEAALGTLQHRYETRTKEVHQVRKERDILAESIIKHEQKTEKLKEELMKLKDERTQLKHDLESARNALKEEGGLLADIEATREENRRLAKENASLERKAEYEKKQAEYTREQYQNASTAAAQSGNEIRQLLEENAELKRKLDAEVVKLREIRVRNDETRHLSRIQELEQSIEARDDLLRRKEDELRNIRNNRPATRATSSQPRSPKWGPGNSRPTSPGVNNSGLAGRPSALRFSSEMPF